MFEIIVADLRVCQRDGIDCGGNVGRIFPIVLANKGDWSYLAPWCIKQVLYAHFWDWCFPTSPFNILQYIDQFICGKATHFLLLYVIDQQVRYPAVISRDLTGVHQRGQEIQTKLELGFVTFAWLAME